MTPSSPVFERGLLPAIAVLLTGVVAALHVAKIPPTLPILSQELGISLVEAGFLLSLVHISGMTISLALGLAIGGWGLKRGVLGGLLLLTLTSLAAGWANSVTELLLLRSLEGVGFLLVVLAGPGLLRFLTPQKHLTVMLGMWSSYMPVGSGMALLLGPVIIGMSNWHWWLWLLALITSIALICAYLAIPDDKQHKAPRTAASPDGWRQRLSVTLRAPGPWLIGFAFGVYAGQWLAVIGFLPSVYAAAGITGGLAGVLTALVALINAVGTASSGRLLQRGLSSRNALNIGFVAMGLSTFIAFANIYGITAPPSLQYIGVLLFSAIGGIIPGTLFNLAVRFSPNVSTVPTTVGWMQQWSACGQLLIPPGVGWLASTAGGWHLTWIATGVCSLAGLVFAALIGKLLAQPVTVANHPG